MEPDKLRNLIKIIHNCIDYLYIFIYYRIIILATEFQMLLIAIEH